MPEDPLPSSSLPSDEDIELRFQRIKDQLAVTHTSGGDEVELELHGAAMVEKVRHVAEIPLPHAEFSEIDAKVEELKRRAEQAKRNHAKDFSQDPKKVASSSKNARAGGLGLVVAYMIVGFPLAGAAIGILVDKTTHSQAWTGILTAIGFVVGLAVTVGMVNKNAKDL